MKPARVIDAAVVEVRLYTEHPALPDLGSWNARGPAGPWVEVADAVQERWITTDGGVTFAPPPSPPVAEVREAWLKQPDQAGDVTDPGGRLREMARAHVLGSYSLETQVNFATGLYADPDELEVYRQFVADTITEYHRVRDLIVAAPDEAAINAAVATLSWPTPPA